MEVCANSQSVRMMKHSWTITSKQNVFLDHFNIFPDKLKSFHGMDLEVFILTVLTGFCYFMSSSVSGLLGEVEVCDVIFKGTLR